MLYNNMIIALLAAGCSCVFVTKDDEYAYCISAAHCVKAPTDTATYDGKRFGVRWIHVDPKHDLAIGKAFKDAIPDVVPTIAQGKPGPATIIGYPNRQPEVRTADLDPEGPETDGAPKQLLRIAPPLVGGTSGGGVFQNGALVGIATHTSCEGGRCTTTRDLYRETTNAGVDLDPSKMTTRDLLIAFIGALIARWYYVNKLGAPPSTQSPSS